MTNQQIHESGSQTPFSFRLLPHIFQKIGLAIAIISFLSMIAVKYSLPDLAPFRILAKQALMVGLLLISISRDQIEDELTFKLRMQAFSAAFICGVIYALGQPYFDWLVDSFFHPENATIADLSATQIISFMLLINVGFYQLLKRIR